jgi:hypothetical protein
VEELSNGKGKLVEASEEGQGPRRAVEPMMMMEAIVIKLIVRYMCHIFLYVVKDRPYPKKNTFNKICGY